MTDLIVDDIGDNLNQPPTGGWCFSCRRELCAACRGNCTCPHLRNTDGIGGSRNTQLGSVDNMNKNEGDDESDTNEDQASTRKRKGLDALRDPLSTGRKEAAKLYPLDKDKACEWSQASESNPLGGGSKPITSGCSNKQSMRHHGPDKNTLNNENGNVHRICAHHHNLWHFHNDPDYDMNLTATEEH